MSHRSTLVFRRLSCQGHCHAQDRRLYGGIAANSCCENCDYLPADAGFLDAAACAGWPGSDLDSDCRTDM